jgi:DNA polymerase-3 subunit delta
MTAYLITGSDPSLVSRALTDLLAELTGSPDGKGSGGPAEIEEFEPADSSDEGEGRGRHDVGPILAALSTPAWLSDHRVVVVRDAGALSAAQGAELAKLVAEPPTDNVLVLASPGRAVPQAVSRALKAARGTVIDTDPGRTARDRSGFLEAHLRRVPVHLDAAARRALTEHLGEDAAGLDPILELLVAAYGPGARITPAELEPLLGEEGAAPPWALTDAIDSGDGEEAIRSLHRLLGPNWPAVRVLASLHRHVSGLLRLDGADDVRNADDAAAVLGIHAFPARKLLEQARRLGHDRIVRAVEVLADADADLRGRVGWTPELVMEVAVARLAQLSRATARPAQTPRSAGPGRR